eukprot:gb/GEZN01007971.1/.p1 GENE.gb/GEZN01007971.1/~~gb/GEZN01007971.1/.p1  ORF type:complete len:333 (+),score=25.45 gb/GEZN01007971.1/:135-1001(+)
MVLNGFAGSDNPPWPLGGSIAGMSDITENPITPAGWTFAIWGLIYTCLAAYVIWQSLPSQANHPLLTRLALMQGLNQALSMCWIFAWTNKYWITSQMLLTLNLVALVNAYQSMGVGVAMVPLKEKLFCHLAISLNASWLLVANLAGLSAVIKAEGFTVTADWAVGWLTVACIVASYVGLTRGDIAWVCIFTWACAGIACAPKDRYACSADKQVVKIAASVAAAVAPVSCLIGLYLQYLIKRDPSNATKTHFDTQTRALQFWVWRDELSKEHYHFIRGGRSDHNAPLLG